MSHFKQGQDLIVTARLILSQAHAEFSAELETRAAKNLNAYESLVKTSLFKVEAALQFLNEEAKIDKSIRKDDLQPTEQDNTGYYRIPVNKVTE